MATKTTIFRLDRVATRFLKTRYGHLSRIQKKYVKLVERIESIERSTNSFWLHVKRDPDGKASVDNDWKFYHYIEGESQRVHKQIDRFVARHGLDETKQQEIKRLHALNNLSPGGSY